ncbi:MAG: endoribonuclease YicC domain-containing protein, partial [Planctomycetia bacterium]
MTPAPHQVGPRSMTGCGEAAVADGANSCRVELRCVNNRFFKLSFRAREGFGILEPQAEELIRRRVRRGAVQVDLDVTGPAAPAARRLDRGQLEAYLDDLADFCATHDLPMPRSIDALLGLPGILVDAPPDGAAVERAWPLVARALEAALDRHDAMRRAEGAALAAAMRDLLREVTTLVAAIRVRVPQVLEEHRARLVERVGKLLAQNGTTLSEADIAHEVALVADRSDVAEELVRLESHVAQFD